jgi:hypothetical protein
VPLHNEKLLSEDKMAEKRKYQRYACKLKAKYDYYEGNPDDMDIATITPIKGDGYILDISQGGLFIITNERVAIGMPIRINFKTKKEDHSIMGKIIRTGLLKNNPSEVALKFARFSAKGDAYIAIEFDETIPEISDKDI